MVLPARLDQSVALPQEDLHAVNDDRQLGQRPSDAGEPAGQAGQLLLDRLRRRPGGKQLRQPLGRGHFVKVEIRQPPHLARRRNQPPTMPSPNHRQRDAEQFGQHGGRVKAMDVRLLIDQPKALPELRFRNQFEGSGLQGGAGGVVEPRLDAFLFRGRQSFFAEDHEVGRRVRLVQHGRPESPDQLPGLAAAHAGQPADEREAFSPQQLRRIALILGHGT